MISSLGVYFGEDWAPHSLANAKRWMASGQSGVARVEMVRLAVYSCHDVILHAGKALCQSAVALSRVRLRCLPRPQIAQVGQEVAIVTKLVVATVCAPLVGVISPDNALKMHAWLQLPGPKDQALGGAKGLFLLVAGVAATLFHVLGDLPIWGRVNAALGGSISFGDVALFAVGSYFLYRFCRRAFRKVQLPVRGPNDPSFLGLMGAFKRTVQGPRLRQLEKNAREEQVRVQTHHGHQGVVTKINEKRGTFEVLMNAPIPAGWGRKETRWVMDIRDVKAYTIVRKQETCDSDQQGIPREITLTLRFEIKSHQAQKYNVFYPANSAPVFVAVSAEPVSVWDHQAFARAYQKLRPHEELSVAVSVAGQDKPIRGVIAEDPSSYWGTQDILVKTTEGERRVPVKNLKDPRFMRTEEALKKIELQATAKSQSS